MLWHKIKSSIKEKLPETIFSLWIDPLVCVQEEDQSIELGCPDSFFCTWVKEKYFGVIRESMNDLGAGSKELNFSVSKNRKQAEPGLPDIEEKEQLRLPSMPKVRSSVRNLHPRYTFDEFMVGESNALSQSACQAIANGDNSFGPFLYINAGNGLGKTHLTHAVAHFIIDQSPGTQIQYLTAQQFSAEMVGRIKTNSMDKFKEKYHNNCDILLLEDVHTMTGKAKTQAELNEVLDSLIKTGKRIILTGAMAPVAIPDIDANFRSRMSAGLISTINPPDLKTRFRIIRRKAENVKLPLTDELVELLAQNVRGDIRKLESVIVGLKARSSLLKTAPDLDMVKELLFELIGQNPELTVETIKGFVADQFKVSVNDLKSRSRKRSIAFPRQVSMYLARRLTDQGLAEIGRAFNRDHSTVLHSIRVITEEMARSASIRGQVDLLVNKLKK